MRIRKQLTPQTHAYVEVPDLPADAITVNLGAGGLGDALLCLAAIKGLNRLHGGRAIRYRVASHAIPFVELFDGGYFDVITHDCDNCADLPKSPVPAELQANVGYGNECRTKCAIPRIQRWCRNLGGVTPELPALRDRDAVAAACPVEHLGTVCLAPFSTWSSREYPIHAWQTLERELLERGYRVLTLDARDGRYPDRHLQMRGEKLVDAPALQAAAVLLNAKCLVSNDSGLAHLGSLLGTPTLVLCGQTLHKDIYAFYGEHVHALEGHLDCRGCYWQPPYHSAKCDPVCPNLASNAPAEILAKVRQIAGPPAPGRASTFHLEPGETGKAHRRRLAEGWYVDHVEAPAIDIGCGRDPLLAPFPVRRWDHILGDGDCTVMAGAAELSYRTVYASHVLEHVPDPARALARWWGLVAPGGKLIVAVPHRDLYEGKRELPSAWNGDHKTFWLPDAPEIGDPPHTRGLRQVLEAALPDAELLSLRVLDEGHAPPDPIAGVHAQGEYSIEAVLRKPVAGEVAIVRPDRAATFAAFLRGAGAAPLIVETGTLRSAEDLGDGRSTLKFARFLEANGGRLVSIDSSIEAVAFAQAQIGFLADVIHAEGAAWLSGYQGPPIGGLYLDSLDADQEGSAEACLAEAIAAQPHLAAHARILIDDTPTAWTGKGRLAGPWLLEHGWRVERHEYQALFARE